MFLGRELVLLELKRYFPSCSVGPFSSRPSRTRSSPRLSSGEPSGLSLLGSALDCFLFVCFFFPHRLRNATLNILVLRAPSKDVRLVLSPRLSAFRNPPLEVRAQAARVYNQRARTGIAAPKRQLLFGSVEQTLGFPSQLRPGLCNS